MPSLERTFQLVAESQALREAATAAIAATRYRLQHHDYPATLPNLPLDPFTGRPLLYHKNPDRSLTLYSVGKDLQDGNGQIARTPHALPKDTGLTLLPPNP